MAFFFVLYNVLIKIKGKILFFPNHIGADGIAIDQFQAHHAACPGGNGGMERGGW